MKTVFFSFILLIISLSVKSQVDLLVVGGNNASFYNYDLSVGYFSGLMADMSFSKNFGLQIGTQFSSIQVNTTSPIYALSSYYPNGMSAEYQYIETPVSLTYKIPFSQISALKFNIGGYCAFAIGGEAYYRNITGQLKYVPVNDVSESFLYGILSGIAFQKNKLLVGVEMNFNLYDYNVPVYVLKTKLGIKF